MKNSEPDIKLAKKWGEALTPHMPGPDSRGPLKDMAQELCAAHVHIEKQFMQAALASSDLNVCDPRYLCDLHAGFYAHLPPEHLFTHTGAGYTKLPVNPGHLRDIDVSVDGQSRHDPGHQALPELLETFGMWRVVPGDLKALFTPRRTNCCGPYLCAALWPAGRRPKFST